jgi:putative PEP-CTERM system TPR-repeat lipoprotein
VGCALGATLVLSGCGGESAESLVTSAKVYLGKNDGKAAVIQLKTALQKKPDSSEARFLLGKALLLNGDGAAAGVELNKALELKYPASEAAPLLAQALVISGDYKKLVDRFGQLDLPDPDAAASLKTQVAIAYAMQDDTENAHQALQTALRAKPGYAPAIVVQARMAAEARHFDEALTLVDQALAGAPEDADAWFYKGQFLFYGKDDRAGALAAYRKALSIAPAHVLARVSTISLLLAQGDLKSATTEVAELRKQLPGRPQTLYVEAQLAFSSHDYKRARDLAQQLMKSFPDNVEVLQLDGAVNFANGSLLEAERSLGKAVKLVPGLPAARRLLIQTYLRSNQPDMALATLEPLLAQPDADAQTFALAAQAYLQTGDLAQAEANFSRAARLDPNDTRSRTALALAHIRMGDTDTGVAELQAAAAVGRDTYADMALVSLYLRNRDLDRAMKTIDGIEQKQPNRPFTAYLRGQIFQLRKDPVQARRSFEQALAIDAAYLPATTALALLDMADQKPEVARKRFEAVLKSDPTNAQALMAIAGIRSREGASNAEVAKLFDDAAKLNPNDSGLRVMLIDRYIAQKDFKSAVNAAQDAVAAMPDKPDVLDALGRAQLASGETNQAITSFNKLVALDPKATSSYLRQADAYLLSGDADAAEQSIRRALGITPDLLAAQQMLVGIELKAGRPDDALQVARAVQKQRPTAIVGLMLEGTIQTSRKDYQAAADVYRAALKKLPSTEAAIRLHNVLLVAGKRADADKFEASWLADHPKDAVFLFHLGELLELQHDYKAAAARFLQVVGLQPENASGLNNLAWALAMLKQPGAVGYAEKANALVPNVPSFVNTLATALAAENQLAKAVETQKKALDLAAGDPDQRLNLARMYVQAGDKAAARTELETLAKLGDKFTGQPEVASLLKAL